MSSIVCVRHYTCVGVAFMLSTACQLGCWWEMGSFHLGHHFFAEFHMFGLLSNYTAAVYVSMLLTSLLPRHHPLKRKVV